MKAVITNCLLAPFRKYPFQSEFSFYNIPALTKVDVIGEKDEFYKVVYEDEWGYVDKKYVVIVEE